MKYLKEQVETKIIIKKSEFIGILYPIFKDSDIEHAISDAKKRYPKATHYVTAWVRGDKAQYASSNDDGEPSRTAGYPALEVLMKNQVTDLIIVIIRYFGGIMLGAGGLIRAYSSSASETIKAAKFYKKYYAKKYQLKFSYALINDLEHFLGDSVIYVKKDYLEQVTYEIIFLKDDISLLDQFLHQISITELEDSEEHIDV